MRARDESRRRGLIRMWYREVGSAQLTSSCVGEEVLQRKTYLLAFWRDGKEKMDSISERVEKHHPLRPHSSRTTWGRGRDVWLVVHSGCCCFGKNLLSFECLLPGQGEQILKRDCCKQLAWDCCLLMPSSHLVPAAPVLRSYPCTTCLVFTQGNQSVIYRLFRQSQELLML